ncbi:MAG TPA: DUF423 domain-containing protein [Thiolinea sp.]|nr:DUF423 domain-containing protein [Thiolinea sp.]
MKIPLPTGRHLLLGGSLAGLLAVTLGAFGAHGLEKIVTPHMLQRFHTGVEYQFYHALALLATGLLLQSSIPAARQRLSLAGLTFLAGIFLFSGSLYLYVLSGLVAFALVTPLGGICFIAGWLFLLLGIYRSPT